MPPRWALFTAAASPMSARASGTCAEADLEHALELKPDQPLVLNYLGYSWIDRGEKLTARLEDDREGGRAAARGRLHRRQPGLGALPARRLRRAPSSTSKRRSSWCPRTRRSTTIWATPIGRAGGMTEARYQWRRRCSSSPTRKTSSRSRPSSSSGLPTAVARRPAAAERQPSCRGTVPSGGHRPFAPAKINLYLHVTGRRADGYHLLDSLVAFADIGDRVTRAPAADAVARRRRARGGGPRRARRRQSGAARRPRCSPRRRRRPRRRRAASGQEPAGRLRHRRRVERRGGGAAGALPRCGASRSTRRAGAGSARGSAPMSRSASRGALAWVGGIGEEIDAGTPTAARRASCSPTRAVALPTAAVFPRAHGGPYRSALRSRFAPMPRGCRGARRRAGRRAATT